VRNRVLEFSDGAIKSKVLRIDNGRSAQKAFQEIRRSGMSEVYGSNLGPR